MTAEKMNWFKGLDTNIDRPIWFGGIAVAAFISTIGIWSVAAPLSGAVIASGQITVAAQNQQVQHPRGGVVSNIFVKDGQHVTRGELIVLLDPTVDRSTRDLKKMRKTYLTALQKRLQLQFEAIQKTKIPEALRQILAIETQKIAKNSSIQAFSADQQRRLTSSLARLVNELGGLQARRRSSLQTFSPSSGSYIGLRVTSLRWGEFDAGFTRIKEGRRPEAPLILCCMILTPNRFPLWRIMQAPEFFGTEKHIWLQQRNPLSERIK